MKIAYTATPSRQAGRQAGRHSFAYAHRALVSTGATGAAAPEFFEGNKAKKKIFMELEKIYISKKILHQYFQNPNEGPD